MVSVATVVAFHAYPDDEVLLTGGTLARLAAEGNRVVVVVATDGVMGPAGAGRRPRRARDASGCGERRHPPARAAQATRLGAVNTARYPSCARPAAGLCSRALPPG
jgi:LmbE family N-acetylglucosaminyl deacetylase